jgi:hypothetical protein
MLCAAVSHVGFLVFCNSLLANRTGVAASLLLYVATAHLVPWSCAACCLQIALEWLRQSYNDEFAMIFPFLALSADEM